MQNEIKEDPYLRSFFDYLFIEKGLSKNTVDAYKTDILNFNNWIKHNNRLDVKKASISDINNYIAFLFKSKLKSSSINRKISSLKALYLYLVKKNVLSKSPIDELVIPKQGKYLPISMSEQEVEKLLNSPDISIQIEKRDKAMIEMMYATGMRISELVNLKITDIDMKRSVVKVLGKGSKERLIPFGESASEAIE